MNMAILFDVAVLLRGGKELRRILLPFPPNCGNQIELTGSVYIVTKTMYDLSAYQGGCGSAIPTKTFVRMKTDDDF